eukprot:4386971-Pleurochrysis_carterae.AAC.3
MHLDKFKAQLAGPPPICHGHLSASLNAGLQWIFWLLGLLIGVTCVWSTTYLQACMVCRLPPLRWALCSGALSAFRTPFNRRISSFLCEGGHGGSASSTHLHAAAWPLRATKSAAVLCVLASSSAREPLRDAPPPPPDSFSCSAQ